MSQTWKQHGPDFNAWNDDLDKFAALLHSVKDERWWIKDFDLKYLTVRIDTRDNGFVLFCDGRDGTKERISPDRVVAAIERYLADFPSRRPHASQPGIRPAPQDGDEVRKYLAARDPEWRRVFDALRGYRLSNIRYEEGDGYCLVDLMTREGVAITDGELELVSLADDIASALDPAPDATTVDELAEHLCETYASADPDDDGKGRAWPYAQGWEKDSWRAVANAAISKLSPQEYDLRTRAVDLYRRHTQLANAVSATPLDLSNVDWEEWYRSAEEMPLSGPGHVQLWEGMAKAVQDMGREAEIRRLNDELTCMSEAFHSLLALAAGVAAAHEGGGDVASAVAALDEAIAPNGYGHRGSAAVQN